MINQGEKDEILVKLRLIELRDEGAELTILGKKQIVKNVGFGKGFLYREYNSLPSGTDLKMVQRRANMDMISAMEELGSVCGIKKAGTRDKADVFINGKGFSVKSLQASPPALVNHTPRKGWCRIADELGIDISSLDQLVDEYWEKRERGIITEDVRNENPQSPFRNHKEILRPYLEYFLFKGTGSGDSKNPAEGMLEFHDPLNVNTWSFTKDGYLDKVWPNLIFSIRNKGMSPDYPNCAYSSVIKKWTRFFDGSYKGSLHVRIHD